MLTRLYSLVRRSLTDAPTPRQNFGEVTDPSFVAVVYETLPTFAGMTPEEIAYHTRNPRR